MTAQVIQFPGAAARAAWQLAERCQEAFNARRMDEARALKAAMVAAIEALSPEELRRFEARA